MFRYMILALIILVALATSSPDISHASTMAPEPQKDSNLTFLFAAYAITWLSFFGYVYIMARRQRNLAREIKDLQLALKEIDKD